MAAIAAVKPDVEVHGIIASAENMPDADAYRPGDVFGSLDGKTVEIINTDAEGRLVLADALAYARGSSPTCSSTTLRSPVRAWWRWARRAPAFMHHRELATQFADAAKEAGEQFWRLPLLEDLKDQLKSDIADLKHTGDRWGGRSPRRSSFASSSATRLDPRRHRRPAFGDRASGCLSKGATGHGVLTSSPLSRARSRNDRGATETDALEKTPRPRDGPRDRRLSYDFPRRRILVAVSGGKDSYTMQHLLARSPRARPFRSRSLRSTSTRAIRATRATFSNEYMAERGPTSPWSMRTRTASSPKRSPKGKTYCSLCSRLRRGILYRVATELGCTKIALGHHRDDMLVTLLLESFLFGSAQGDAAQAHRRRRRHVVIRPLIYCAEDDIRAFAAPRVPDPAVRSLRVAGKPSAQNHLQHLRNCLEKDNPGLRTSALAALMNVRPSHLLDVGLWKKLGLEVAREEDSHEVSVGRGTEVRGEPAPPSELAPCSTCWFPVSMRGA